ncbi:MAG: hypothetical protein HOP18_09300 [Deltaproteobacteria bacterium]|nr:hypothetical protein [Deltaproteobacteria bacterium]
MKDTVPLMTDEDIDAIHARCAAATPGPWRSYVEGRDHTSGDSFIMTGEGDSRGEDIELSGATPADQDFIAHARQDIPRLLAEVRRLRDLEQGKSSSLRREAKSQAA